jgi:hypothetical protein
LLNALTLLSLVLCAAVVALWVRSYVVFDSWCWASPDERVAVQASHGRFWVWQEKAINGTTPFAAQPPYQRVAMRPAFPLDRYRRVETGPFRNWLGFDAWSGVFRGNVIRWREVVVPYWPFLLVSAALPARWYVCRRRARLRRLRHEARLCPACGYDLRGTPDRCPECGSTAAASLLWSS